MIEQAQPIEQPRQEEYPVILVSAITSFIPDEDKPVEIHAMNMGKFHSSGEFIESVLLQYCFFVDGERCDILNEIAPKVTREWLNAPEQQVHILDDLRSEFGSYQHKKYERIINACNY